MKNINKEECRRILSYLHLDHVRRNGNKDWELSVCLLEFAYDLMSKSCYESEPAGCDCEFCSAKYEMAKQGKEFVEVYE